ncbi:MAG: Peptidase penicillin amidase, partial [Solirubrobacterales bacterium]|nr:Peptidase penicillin amidase [Solirubrobacterales bacterium]
GTPAQAAASARAAGPLAQAIARFQPRLGGSYMFAARRADGHAFLFNGPQLGFDAPEKLLELELHAPGVTLRGMTAPGAPVIAAGFNDHVAFGITTGASDTDDLYAEELVPGHPEQYRFRGEVRDMDCRTETLTYRSPPSDLLSMRVPEVGSRRVRLCRTIHGPVQQRAGHVAYARRFATWNRELDTLMGLAEVGAAKSVQDVQVAARKLSWNENLMAADDRGHIGYWHPGLSPLRPRGWDERLPYPGTGEAEWRGLLPAARMPHVIDPRQGWLANWNNLPSMGWTAGDGTARKRLDGPFFRVSWLMRLVRDFAKAPSIPAMEGLLHRSGTVAQQYPIATARLRRAQRGAAGPAKTVLDTLLAWDGSYDRTAPDGTVDPGVATWDAFRAAAADIALAPFGAAGPWLTDDDHLRELYGGYHPGTPYHLFDATHAEAYALGHLKAAELRTAAAQAAAAVAKHFGTEDPARWREPRRTYALGAVGAASPPSIPFFDRGTYEQLVEVGPA